MHSIYVDSRFEKRLDMLRKAGKKAAIAAQKIKNCIKYDLGNGYRLITIKQGENVFVLFAGTHDECHRCCVLSFYFFIVTSTEDESAIGPQTLKAELITPNGDTVTGTCRMDGDRLVLCPNRDSRQPGGCHHGPPPEAFSACKGKSAGDTAEFVDPRGKTVSGTCEQCGDRLALRPNRKK